MSLDTDDMILIIGVAIVLAMIALAVFLASAASERDKRMLARGYVEVQIDGVGVWLEAEDVPKLVRQLADEIEKGEP